MGDQGMCILEEENKRATPGLNPPGSGSENAKSNNIRDEVKKGSIVIGKIPTQHQLADALTKALHRERHHELMLKFSGYSSPKI